MHDGIIYTGVPNKAELKNAPGIPAADRIKPGGTVGSLDAAGEGCPSQPIR